MKSYSVIFENPVTKEKQKRTYPKKAQFSDKNKLAYFLNNREFLTDFRVLSILEADEQKEQMKFAQSISKFKI